MHYFEIIKDLEVIKNTTYDSNAATMIDYLITKIRNGG